jgi:ATP-dependent RNA helicase DHX29
MAQRFQISADTEAQVRAVLKSLPVEPAAVAAWPAYRNLRERALDVYAKVAAEGFADAPVQAALRALVCSGGNLSVAAAFDWLCINAPEALPAKFSAGERHASKGGAVNVLTSARDDVVPDTVRRTAVVSPPAAALRDDDREDSPSRAEAARADEREREKAWIRRYMEEQSSEEEDLDEFIDVQPHTDAGVQEQADNTRSQAHLAALADSPESRQALALELQRARGDAKQAKALGDAGAQQRAGAIIRVVREQLDRLAITEADCFAALEASGEQTAAAAAPSSAPMPVEDFGSSMFDETAVGPTPPAPRAPALSTILSHAARQPTAPKAKPGKAAASPAPVQQQPRSVLQQHCARHQWPAPRFERLPAGSAGLRYSVTLTCDLPGRRGKRQMQTVTVELPADCAIGSSIEEAQNAVAARALYQLLPDQPLHRELAAPYGDLWRGWLEDAARNGTDEIRDREAAVSSFVDALVAEDAALRRSSRASGAHGSQAPGVGEDAAAWEAREAQPARRPAPAPAVRDGSAAGARLREQLLSRERNKAYADIAKQRASLPIALVRTDIAAALSASDMLVVCGETGCGKTTQVPQYLLDDAIMQGSGASCSIIVTQPRRVAAMSVADRVAFERLEAAPGAPGASVGYQVRLDAARTSATQLLFCTAGILLRRLHGDPLLEGTSHVVVDEVHERSLQTDLLLTILRDLSVRRVAAGRPGVKVVLMSATVDATFFAGYLEGCPVVSAVGRSFPVEQHYLEDVYESCSYLLPIDSAAALRPAKSARQQPARGGDRQRAKLVEEGWVRLRDACAPVSCCSIHALLPKQGDEDRALDGGYHALNPSYDPALVRRRLLLAVDASSLTCSRPASMRPTAKRRASLLRGSTKLSSTMTSWRS